MTEPTRVELEATSSPKVADVTAAHQTAALETLRHDYTATARAARVYEHLLGGVDAFKADRSAAHDLCQVAPWAPRAARANKHFTHVATTTSLALGVRQFLDLGAGFPHHPFLHEMVPPGYPVVYVDRDPGVLAHAKCRLDPGPPYKTAVVAADLLHMQNLLTHEHLTGALDLTQPIAVTLHDVLPWSTDDTAAADAMAILRSWLPTGSTLSITHLTGHFDPHGVRQAVAAYERHDITVRPRGLAEIAALFGDFVHLSTGLKPLSRWSIHDQPAVRQFTPHPARSEGCPAFAGIAVKS
ncbi:SAM-dependent methyltransferase [Streptomyces albipurpureus]|uniref:SAM-dependent methyltransferase n=1 Tax=Streptomyces albipurpureus TaxID=2897419 RepID=A0ABT0UME2_9ACTN|nr:SAM-dependent methyltransferase [Streptomyces sp. CWNU-1]MCM2388795.1 SAM-dependent methyltransferase [Streptomyces sp. CWNU-1]